MDTGVNGTYRVGRPSAQRQLADGRRYLYRNHRAKSGRICGGPFIWRKACSVLPIMEPGRGYSLEPVPTSMSQALDSALVTAFTAPCGVNGSADLPCPGRSGARRGTAQPAAPGAGPALCPSGLCSAARRRPAARSCLSERHAYPWPSGLASRWRPRSCSCTELVRATRCQAQRRAPPRHSRPRSRGGNYSGTRRAGAHLVVVHDAVPRAQPAGSQARTSPVPGPAGIGEHKLTGEVTPSRMSRVGSRITGRAHSAAPRVQ